MARRVRMTVLTEKEHLAKLKRNLEQKASAKKRTAIRQESRKVNKEIMNDAKKSLPTKGKGVDKRATGALRKSAKVKPLPSNFTRKKWVGTETNFSSPTGDQFYGYFQEQGWRPARHSKFMVKGDKDSSLNTTRKKISRDNSLRRRKGREERTNSKLQGGKVPGKFYLTLSLRYKQKNLTKQFKTVVYANLGVK